MRHCLNLFLGDACSRLSLDVLRHVLQYADSETSRFVQTRGVVVTGSGTMVSEAVRRKAPESFTIEYGSPWLAEAAEAECIRDIEGWRTLLSDCHSHSITIAHPGDSNRLLVSLCLLAADSVSVRTAADIMRAARQLDGMFEVDVLLLGEDVGHSAFGLPAPADASNDALRRVAETLENDKDVHHIVALSGRNSSGISLDMTLGTLTRLLATYCTLCAERYMSVYNLADDGDLTRRVIVPGLSVLEFDRYLLINYLLNRTYRSVLEDEGVGQKTVDINTVALPADQLVCRHKDFMSRFWDEQVKTLVERGHTASEIAAMTERPLAQIVDDMEADMKSLFSRHDLSLPEKQGVMAMLLGEDDPLLTGQLFNEEQHYIEDVDTEAVRLFAGDTAIDKLRWLKREIRRSTAYIRQKSAELEALGLSLEEEGEPQLRRLSDGGFSWGDSVFRLTPEAEERPLAATYKAHRTTEASVDLRPWFPPVRNQGALGSCSAHSGVAVMEYLLQKSGNERPDLSEAFLYYNTRRRRGQQHVDSGATIFDMLSSLQDDGVCEEKLCPYRADKVSEKPSPESYADGRKRRVTGAKNVNLTLDDFRSALSDGLPIIISMKMYERFDAPKGFVRRPTAKDRVGGQGNHAMLVCGYSDKNRVFIVRNSWGKKFGDKGYCYMPYSFVEKDKMLSMAAVITSTSMSDVKVIGLNSTTAVTFDQADASIRGALLQNLIEEERSCLEELKREYAACRAEYDAVVLSQGGSNSKDEALAKAKAGLQDELDIRQGKLSMLKAERERETSMAEAQDTKERAIGAATYMGVWLLRALVQGLGSFLFVLVMLLVGLLLWFVAMYVSERRKMRLRKKYDAQINDAIQAVADQKKALDLLSVKGVIYAMALEKSQRMQSRLKQQYRSTCAYVSHLAAWLRDEQRRAEGIVYQARAPFISCISTDSLDEYFLHRRREILGDLRLSDYLRDYALDADGLERFKRELKERIAAALNEATADFSMLRYITGLQQYPYLPPPEDVALLMPMLGRKGVPFLPVRDSADNCQVDHALFIHSDTQGERNHWEQASSRHFNMRPMHYDWHQPTSLVLLQLRRIAPEDVK